MQSITIAAVSNDKTRILVVPDQDSTRGLWVDVGTDLSTITFPKPVSLPSLRLAMPGEGKGIKGGFSSLGRRA